MKIWFFASIVCIYSVDVLASCWGCCCCGGSSAVVPTAFVSGAGAATAILVVPTVPSVSAAADAMRDCIGVDSSRLTPRLSTEEQERIYLRERENPEFLWSSLSEAEANEGLTPVQEAEVGKALSTFIEKVMGVDPDLMKRLKHLMPGYCLYTSLYERKVFEYWNDINCKINMHYQVSIADHNTKVIARCIVMALES